MLDARILQAQGYTQMQIAQLLGVTDRTVRTYLKERPCARKKPVRPSKLDPFKPFIEELLERNPSYNGELLYERIVAQGYGGKKTVMKAYVAELRKKLSHQAVMRFETEPGRQAQVDWKEFGRHSWTARKRSCMPLSWCWATHACPLCGSRPTCASRRCWLAMLSPSTTLEEFPKRSSTTTCAPRLNPTAKVSGTPRGALPPARFTTALSRSDAGFVVRKRRARWNWTLPDFEGTWLSHSR